MLIYVIGRYEEFNNLKLVNPNLKTMLAVGGKALRNYLNSDIFILQTSSGSMAEFLLKTRYIAGKIHHNLKIINKLLKIDVYIPRACMESNDLILILKLFCKIAR